MKPIKKQNQHPGHPQLRALRKFARRPKDLDRPASPLQEVIIRLDDHAAQDLMRHPLGINYLSIGSEDNALVMRATVNFSDLFKIASWAYRMKPHIAVRSPWFLREAVKLTLPAPQPVRSDSFAV